MTVLWRAINLTRVAALGSRPEKREDKEAILRTSATGSADHFVDTTAEHQFL